MLNAVARNPNTHGPNHQGYWKLYLQYQEATYYTPYLPESEQVPKPHHSNTHILVQYMEKIKPMYYDVVDTYLEYWHFLGIQSDLWVVELKEVGVLQPMLGPACRQYDLFVNAKSRVKKNRSKK